MVTFEINKNELFRLAAIDISDEKLIDLLANLKVEAKITGDNVLCELTPDRADMLSVIGIARALRQYMGIEPGMQQINIQQPQAELKVEDVRARQYIAAAFVRNLKIDEKFILDIMHMQEYLHATIGRDRKKVAIGIHDAARIQDPFTYKEVRAEDVRFIPLGSKRQMSLAEILKEHPKGKSYAHILSKYDFMPLLLDAKERVISFPPIINASMTEVTKDTRDIFIEVTGTDKKAVYDVLNIIVFSLAFYGKATGSKAIVEAVKIAYKDNTDITPSPEPKVITIDASSPGKLIGISISPQEIRDLLRKMGYNADITGDTIEVVVPPYRTDIFSEADVIEDIAIAYGYNNIRPELPNFFTTGGFGKKTTFTRKIRQIMIGFGAQEVLRFVLTNKNDNFTKMAVPEDAVVEIANPVSSDYSICRTWLLPSLLKILPTNKHCTYPQKLFTVDDCIIPDHAQETRTRTIRKLCFVMCAEQVNLTHIKSIVEAIMNALGIDFKIKSYDHPSFIPTRVGAIEVKGKTIGFFGEIHPQVLTAWDIDKPVGAIEIEVEPLFEQL